MLLFSKDKKQNASAADEAASRIASVFSDNNAHGSTSATASVTGFGSTVLAAESFDGVSVSEETQVAVNDVCDALQEAQCATSSIDNEDGSTSHILSDTQREAVGYALAASNNAGAWSDANDAISAAAPANKAGEVAVSLNEIQANPGFGGAEEVLAAEAFENPELVTTSSSNAIAAAYMSELAPIAEMFAPTVVVPAGMANTGIHVTVPYVREPLRHAINGAVTEWGRRSLIEAHSDTTILSNNNVTELKHIYRDTGDAETDTTQYLAPASEITPRDVLHDGIEVKTQPIKAGVEVSLLGLNSTDGRFGVNEDDTSQLTRTIGVGRIYFKAVKAGVTEIFSVDTKDIPGCRATRAASANAKASELQLNFNTKTMTLGTDYKLHNGGDSAIFASLATSETGLLLNVNLSGNFDINKGLGRVGSISQVSVAAAHDKEGGYILATDAAIAAAIKDVTIEVAYLDIAGATTNSNFARIGTLTDRETYSYFYGVGTHSPYSSKEELDNSGQPKPETAKNLASIAVRGATNDVLLNLLNYVEFVKRNFAAQRAYNDDLGIMGAGSKLVKAYYDTHEIDCLKDINSTETTEKMDDFRALVTQTLQQMVANADYHSNFSSALYELTSDANALPEALIGVDSVVAQNLIVKGDSRTLGKYNYRIEETPIAEWKGKIVAVLSHKGGQAGKSPLKFGQRFMSVDVLRTAQISGDTTHKRTMIIPRYTVAFNVPVVLELDIKNMDELFKGSVAYQTQGETDVTVVNAVDAPVNTKEVV